MSNMHWLPWLQKQLLIRDIPTATPEVPFSFRLDYEVWKEEFERYDISEETLLVGHSCGAGFLVRWLSEHKGVHVGKVILVAPWMDPKGKRYGDMYPCAIDERLIERTQGVTIFNSDNDRESIQMTVENLRSLFPGIEYREYHEYGHFMSKDLNGDAFPELLQYIEELL